MSLLNLGQSNVKILIKPRTNKIYLNMVSQKKLSGFLGTIGWNFQNCYDFLN